MSRIIIMNVVTIPFHFILHTYFAFPYLGLHTEIKYLCIGIEFIPIHDYILNRNPSFPLYPSRSFISAAVKEQRWNSVASYPIIVHTQINYTRRATVGYGKQYFHGRQARFSEMGDTRLWKPSYPTTARRFFDKRVGYIAAICERIISTAEVRRTSSADGRIKTFSSVSWIIGLVIGSSGWIANSLTQYRIAFLAFRYGVFDSSSPASVIPYIFLSSAPSLRFATSQVTVWSCFHEDSTSLLISGSS